MSETVIILLIPICVMPLLTWTEWLRAKGLRLEDVRTSSRQRLASTPSTGQMQMALGV
jgi:hypothetical protein